MTKIFNKIICFSIYLLVFLLPIFWLPFSFEFYEFNKQHLIFFLVSISFLAWLAKMVLVDKEIRFRKSPLDIPVLIFLLVAILSAIFSVDKTSSLFGFYGRFSNGLIGLLSLGALYFLITNNVKQLTHFDGYPADKKLINTDKENKEIGINQPKSVLISGSGLIKTFLWSVFFVVLISYLSIFGVLAKIPQVPFFLQQRIFNPVSSSLEGLAVFLSIAIVLLVGVIISKNNGQRTKSSSLLFTVHCLLLIAAMGLLIIVDFASAWIVLALSLGFFLIFAISTRILKENVNRLLLPIFLIIVAIAFLLIDISRFGNFEILNLPREQILDQEISWKTSFGAIRENVKSGFLGSGIGTWHYDFAKFKPLEFNQNFWWQIRYDRAGNHIAEILGTMGIFGFLSYLLLIGVFFLISWLIVTSKPKSQNLLPPLMAFLALFLSQFFYYQNSVLAFSFWLFLGLSTVAFEKPISEKKFSLKDFPELSLVFSTFLILLCFFVLGIYFFGVKFYLADLNYAKNQLMPFVDEGIKSLEKAVSFNPKLATYRIVLARNYLFQILVEIGKPIEQQDSTKIHNWVEKAINQAQIATQLAPNSVVAWETLGMIYRDIQLLATGATGWSIKYLQKAIELEPKNPALYTELGKLYLVSDFQKAKENFAKAKELKSDYIDALMQDALIFEREQNLDEAIKRMEELVTNFPFNIEGRFQLGRLYFNKNRVDEAISQFEQVIIIMPNHSNALYSLGLAYVKKGEKEKSIWAFERVLDLNPGNEDVTQKLEQLRK